MDNISLLTGHKPRKHFSDDRVVMLVAPEVRERLNELLYSPAFMGTGVGFSAFIDRACEAAETEYANKLTRERAVKCETIYGSSTGPRDGLRMGK